MAAVEKLGYTPDASARKMRGMRNQIIALSAPIRGDINQARYNAYFLRTAWAARNAGYDVMLLTGPDTVKDIRRVTQSNLADGIVLLDVEQDDERAAQSGTFSKPCVAIGYPSSHAGCACVDIDFALMGRKAVDFLYEKDTAPSCSCATTNPTTTAIPVTSSSSAKACWRTRRSSA